MSGTILVLVSVAVVVAALVYAVRRRGAPPQYPPIRYTDSRPRRSDAPTDQRPERER